MDDRNINFLLGKISSLENQLEAMRTIEIPGGTGWSGIGMTLTYASPTTFTAPGNQTSLFQVGTKFKYNQTTDKFAYIVSSSYSVPNTTVTITGGSDYSLANAAITSPAYSYAAVASGFPDVFNYGAVLSQGASSNISKTTNYARFNINGHLAHITGNFDITGSGTGGSNITLSLPLSIKTNYSSLGTGTYFTSGPDYYSFSIGFGNPSANTIAFIPITAPGILGSSPSIAVASGDSCYFEINGLI
jgi:hypothetical protein